MAKALKAGFHLAARVKDIGTVADFLDWFDLVRGPWHRNWNPVNDMSPTTWTTGEMPPGYRREAL